MTHHATVVSVNHLLLSFPFQICYSSKTRSPGKGLQSGSGFIVSTLVSTLDSALQRVGQPMPSSFVTIRDTVGTG